MQGADDGDTVVVMPIDIFAEQGYYDRIVELGEAVQAGAAELVLLDVEPTYPSEKYGYILPAGGCGPTRDSSTSALRASARNDKDVHVLSERSDPHVILSERSESKDLAAGCSPARDPSTPTFSVARFVEKPAEADAEERSFVFG